MSKHRAPRLAARRGRAGALALALGVTLAVGGAAVGVLPQLTAEKASADQAASRPSVSSPIETASLDKILTTGPASADAERTAKVSAAADRADPAPPPGSGEGRRIVFDQGDQRVWLIRSDESVERTYRVSGSKFENLEPGSYEVLSKTRHATAFDASGTMEYFVRFATGFSEPIGFHSVPRDNSGKLEQTRSQLGQRLSAGCVRQWKPDAIALWDFAPVGTQVVVTA
ncbi:L,D-transpeptidase [Aeromicrobium yanjiei]|uniref:L,D-transpeptidase family protein n=1 Tax=Aeromicrobium yanjiei TaxID=2662028 RepID=A0A5Q2MFR2_9ACTN|nr:L,D-transpeptidase [Aeromicrobium yanjiei]QGG40549.1 L,D-transpeptidase family protein [Aeromicrobium yanjiei]